MSVPSPAFWDHYDFLPSLHAQVMSCHYWVWVMVGNNSETLEINLQHPKSFVAAHVCLHSMDTTNESKQIRMLSSAETVSNQYA